MLVYADSHIFADDIFQQVVFLMILSAGKHEEYLFPS